MHHRQLRSYPGPFRSVTFALTTTDSQPLAFYPLRACSISHWDLFPTTASQRHPHPRAKPPAILTPLFSDDDLRVLHTLSSVLTHPLPTSLSPEHCQPDAYEYIHVLYMGRANLAVHPLLHDADYRVCTASTEHVPPTLGTRAKYGVHTDTALFILPGNLY